MTFIAQVNKIILIFQLQNVVFLWNKSSNEGTSTI